MPRLNRTEYANTTRDLLGTQLDVAQNFPADDVSLGFDNIAQVLSVSPLQFELYEQAAQELAAEALEPGNPARAQIVSCDPTDRSCRGDIFAQFASRAWRRPATTEEVGQLQALVDVVLGEGEGAEAGLELALRGILLSPHFIYRPELMDNPDSSRAKPLDDYALASRLSYFLWSSMPDDMLSSAAADGRLQTDEGLRSEIARMLADPKANALVENFAGQWLRIRGLADHEPDYATFPDWDEALRDAMQQEAKLFFNEFLSGNVGMDELLTANFTFLNQRLASHYDMSFDGGDTLELVNLSNSERAGLLTLGSLLTVTSMPTRTSPVKRGVWVLEQLLCSAPPPPPPGVEGQIGEGNGGGTLREQLERHREDPSCASCHAAMDPIGLGLENYDGVGGYRTEDQGLPIDASGQIGDGPVFGGAAEMAGILQADERLDSCVIEKLFTYALGRPVAASEEDFIGSIAEDFAQSGHSLPELIKLIVLSEPFRTRRGKQEGS